MDLPAVLQIVDSFEAEFAAGPAPDIRGYLKDINGQDRHEVFRHLFSIELEYRTARGEKPALEEYTRSFPEYLTEIMSEFPGQIGNYRAIQILGVGTFARVYRATLGGTGAESAVKLYFDADIDSIGTELEKLRQLEHPGIVQWRHFDRTADGRSYLAMEYLSGGTLSGSIAQPEPLPIPRIVDLALEIASALAAAHKVILAHRDLKPANILLDAAGHAHIADFGLALLHAQRQDRILETAGTAAYMSPEQVRKEPPDERTDIWSFGVILYELLTKRKPFSADSAEELIDQIRYLDPAPVATYRAGVPAGLESICLKCLEKDKTRRFRSAVDLAAALQAMKGGSPARLRRTRWIAAVSAAASILTVAVFLIPRQLRPRPPSLFGGRLAQVYTSLTDQQRSRLGNFVGQPFLYRATANSFARFQNGVSVWFASDNDTNPNRVGQGDRSFFIQPKGQVGHWWLALHRAREGACWSPGRSAYPPDRCRVISQCDNPGSGIGSAWRCEPEIQRALGQPTTCETNFVTPIQQFAGGFIIVDVPLFPSDVCALSPGPTTGGTETENYVLFTTVRDSTGYVVAQGDAVRIGAGWVPMVRPERWPVWTCTTASAALCQGARP